jgi:hypothetical protein
MRKVFDMDRSAQAGNYKGCPYENAMMPTL